MVSWEFGRSWQSRTSIWLALDSDRFSREDRLFDEFQQAFNKQRSFSKPISTCASSPSTVPSKVGLAVAGSQRRLPGNDGAGKKRCLDSGSTYVFSEVRIKTCGWYHSLAPVSEFLTSQGGLVFPLGQLGHFYWRLLWTMTSSFNFVSFLSALLCLKKLETNKFLVFFQGEGNFEILFFCWM